MNVVTLSDASKEKIMHNALSILSKGGLIIYPTETCYGLGADVTNKNAVKRIFEIKKRPYVKKISIAVSSIEMFRQYSGITDESFEKIKKLSKFLPGPLTIVCDGYGLRIPKHDFVLKLIEKFGRPITSTSANISGQPSPKSINNIDKAMLEATDLVIDDGFLSGQPSTVFSLDERNVLRKGPIKKEEIISAL